MKNEYQENGVLRGPLILFVPASNLVAILSLDWLDGTERAAVSAKTHGWNYMANSTENSERSGRVFGELTRPAFRYGADNVRKLVVYASKWIDHDALNTRGQSRSERL